MPEIHKKNSKKQKRIYLKRLKEKREREEMLKKQQEAEGNITEVQNEVL